VDEVISVPKTYIQAYGSHIKLTPDHAYSRWKDEAHEQFGQVLRALPRHAEIVANLQLSPGAAILAGAIETEERRGPFVRHDGHYVVPDVWSQYYLATQRDPRHAIVNWVDLFVDIGGASRTGIGLEYVSEADQDDALALLAPIKGRPYLVVHASASEAQKQWGATSFTIASLRVARELGCGAVLVGGASDHAACAAMAERLRRAGIETVNAAGNTTYDQLAWIVNDAMVVLGNDSFVQHMASARGTPCVTVYVGSPSPWRTLGYREGNRCVSSPGKSGPSVESVVDAMLGRGDQYHVARRVETYLFPFSVNDGPERGWTRTWDTGRALLRVVSAASPLGKDAPMEFPDDWIHTLNTAIHAEETGRPTNPDWVERQLVESRHPLLVAPLMMMIRRRLGAPETDITPAAHYRWLLDAAADDR
jgi:ADP-heptose:LPS heptosyltransferase